jgi:hypothetical protein
VLFLRAWINNITTLLSAAYIRRNKMGGITRIHGQVFTSTNFAGVALRDFTLTFWNGDAYVLKDDANTPAGGIDQVFKTAVSSFASISRIGSLTTGTSASANTIRFAIEALGADIASGGLFLGTGPDNAGQGDAGATTAIALQEAIQALGSVTNSAGAVVHLTSATVANFVY